MDEADFDVYNILYWRHKTISIFTNKIHIFLYTVKHISAIMISCARICKPFLEPQESIPAWRARARIFEPVGIPRIDSKESIPLGCVARWTGTTTLFLTGSQPPHFVLKFQHSTTTLFNVPARQATYIGWRNPWNPFIGSFTNLQIRALFRFSWCKRQKPEFF